MVEQIHTPLTPDIHAPIHTLGWLCDGRRDFRNTPPLLSSHHRSVLAWDLRLYYCTCSQGTHAHGAVFLHNNPVLTMFSSSNYERELNFCSLALFRYAPPILVASTLPVIIADTTEEHSLYTTSLISQSFPAVLQRLAQVLSLSPPPTPVLCFTFSPSSSPLHPHAGFYPCALLHTWTSQLESSTHFLTWHLNTPTIQSFHLRSVCRAGYLLPPRSKGALHTYAIAYRASYAAASVLYWTLSTTHTERGST